MALRTDLGTFLLTDLGTTLSKTDTSHWSKAFADGLSYNKSSAQERKLLPGILSQ